MSRAIVMTIDQAKALKTLYDNGAVTASDFDRHHLERLVAKGWAIKHHNGDFVTYSISGAGRTIYRAL